MARLFADKKGNVFLQVSGNTIPLGVPSTTKGNVLKTRLRIAKGGLPDAQKAEVDRLLAQSNSELENMVSRGAVPRRAVAKPAPQKAAPKPAPKQPTLEESQRRLLELAERTQGKKRAALGRALIEVVTGGKLPKIEPLRKGKAAKETTLITDGGEVYLAVPGKKSYQSYPLRVSPSADAEKIRDALRSLYIRIEKKLSYRQRLEVDALIRKPADELKRMATTQAAPGKAVAVPAAKPVKIDDAIIRRAISGNAEAIVALAVNRQALDSYLSNPAARKRVSNLMFDGIKKVIKAKDAEGEKGLSFDSELLPSIKPPELAIRHKIDSIESLDRLSPEGQALVTRTFLFRFMARGNPDFMGEVRSIGVPPINADPLDAQTLLAAAAYLRIWNARASKARLPALGLETAMEAAKRAPSTQKTEAATEGGKKAVPKVAMTQPAPLKPIAEEDWMTKLLGNCAGAPKDQPLAFQSLVQLHEGRSKLSSYLRDNDARATSALFNAALDGEKLLGSAYSFSSHLKELLARQPADARKLMDYLDSHNGKLDPAAGFEINSIAKLALRSYLMSARALSPSLRIEMENLGEMRANRLPLEPADVLRLGLLARRASLLNTGVHDLRIVRWEPMLPKKPAQKPEDEEFKIKYKP